MIVDDLFESPQTCPECGGPAFSDLLLAEKKDACYNKVRSRYKVWPSAYASGALVQCRKKGAANWGNKSKNKGVAEMDSQGYTGSRDRKKTSKYGSRDHYDLGGSESTGRPLTAKQMMDRAHKAMLKSMSNDKKVDKGWRNPNVDEGAGNIGNSIKALYQKIYRAGDDEIEYFYNDSPIFAQYWDEYEGDLDSIIAEVDPKELQIMHDELESYVEQANLAEEQLDEKCWDTHRQAGMKNKGGRMVPNCVPKEGIEEADKIGHMDADKFDDAMARLKKLAGSGPMKTVWDPVKRVYKNVPVAQQTQDKK